MLTKLSLCCFFIVSFKLTPGLVDVVAVEPVVLAIVKSVLGLLGAHVVQCGQQGSQRRTREQVSEPSCGGSECPTLEETRQCYSTQTVNCQLSSWSAWTACSTVCGVSGIQTITRHRVITEQCGGTCSSTLRKTRACPELSCLNGGSLQQGACFCNKGYSGVCCQKKLKKGKM